MQATDLNIDAVIDLVLTSFSLPCIEVRQAEKRSHRTCKYVMLSGKSLIFFFDQYLAGNLDANTVHFFRDDANLTVRYLVTCA